MLDDGHSKSQELPHVTTTKTSSVVLTSAPSQQRYSIRILGELEAIDAQLAWRVKCALRAATILVNLCFLFYIASVVRGEDTFYHVAFSICVGGTLMCIAVVYYKNFSIAVARLLLREVNVIVIIFTALSLFAIDCLIPSSDFSPFNSFAYVSFVMFFTFLDAVRKKTRAPVLFLGGILFCLTF